MESKTQGKTIVILGAGVSGLVAGYYLSKAGNKVILVEKGKAIGGSAAGFEYKGFSLDYGPHKLYTVIPGIMDEIGKVVPLMKIKKKNSLFLKGQYFDFPLKISQIATKLPMKAFGAGLDILTKPFKKLPDDSYENYLLNRFGKTMYELAFKDYAGKVWNTDPKNLDRELAKKRVAVSSIFALIKSILLNDTENISAEYFYYPPQGIRQLIKELKTKILANGGEIFINTELSKVNVNNGRVESVILNDKVIKTDYFISTIPLNDLVKIIDSPKSVLDAAEELKYQKLSIMYFILNKERALNDCWVFFPEKKFIFQRVSEQKAFSPHTSPKNQTALMVETTKEVTPELIEEMITQLESVGILKHEDIAEYFRKSYGRAYPVYKKGFLNFLNLVTDHLESLENFYTIGRPGLFNYNNIDQCWDMAKTASEHILQRKTRSDWKVAKEVFNNYRIVD